MLLGCALGYVFSKEDNVPVYPEPIIPDKISEKISLLRSDITDGVSSVSKLIIKDYNHVDSLMYVGSSGETHNLRIELVGVGMHHVILHPHLKTSFPAPEGAQYVLINLNVTNIGKQKTCAAPTLGDIEGRNNLLFHNIQLKYDGTHMRKVSPAPASGGFGDPGFWYPHAYPGEETWFVDKYPGVSDEKRFAYEVPANIGLHEFVLCVYDLEWRFDYDKNEC